MEAYKCPSVPDPADPEQNKNGLFFLQANNSEFGPKYYDSGGREPPSWKSQS